MIFIYTDICSGFTFPENITVTRDNYFLISRVHMDSDW